MLRKILGVFKKVLKGEKGYTLIEVAAVVAITATLSAVVVPIALDKVTEGKKTGALGDINTIGGAITSFYKDTGEWPARNGATANTILLLRSGNSSNDDPNVSGTIWATNVVQDTLENHLERDNPLGNVGATTPNNDYLDNNVNWNGPYLTGLNKKRDPWNHNYLINVEAMHTKTQGKPLGEASVSGTTAEYGWVLSAGPDGIVQTDLTDNIVQGDDVGAWFNTQLGRQ